jgi:hypothetical protein
MPKEAGYFVSQGDENEHWKKGHNVDKGEETMGLRPSALGRNATAFRMWLRWKTNEKLN